MAPKRPIRTATAASIGRGGKKAAQAIGLEAGAVVLPPLPPALLESMRKKWGDDEAGFQRELAYLESQRAANLSLWRAMVASAPQAGTADPSPADERNAVETEIEVHGLVRSALSGRAIENLRMPRRQAATEQQALARLERENAALLRRVVRLQKFARVALDTLSANRKRASLPRPKKLPEGGTLEEAIAAYVEREDPFGDLRAKELWAGIFALLDDLGLNPQEHLPEDGDPKKMAYRHDFGSITFGSFQNILTRARARKKSQ